eukprot:CAMPEP_0170544616 /NCGR_PEP_ID=MMETSP0211-20121228/3307_1 /TAXON_ID=311385 /ORGANISM="Pseudokeronopsis sp., Strain OXSARD2" /LENGTH=78 /DNA_ID=CAMNT_0010848303 /DNA_START=911 /DNA_END=1147 /DNA_ORIENTATION=+
MVIIIVYVRIQKKKNQVKMFIQEKVESIKEPVQMIYRGDSGEPDKLNEYYNEYLMKKFGTTDVTEQLFFQSHTVPNNA